MSRHMFLWAVNPFRDKESFRDKAGKLASFLSQKTKWQVEPVFVSDPSEIRITFELASLDKQKIVKFAEEKLEKVLKKWRPKGRLPARTLFQNELSVSASAVELSAHAKKKGGKLILSATHAKGGVGLFGIGSFTQALLSHSAVPVLSMNPDRYRPRPIKRILFATDFSRDSRKAFLKLCELAKSLEAEIIISHIFQHPVYWVPDTNFMYPGLPEFWESDFLKKVRPELQEECELFARPARSARIKVSCSVKSAASSSTFSAIIDDARAHRADMIALAAEGGAFARGVLGTTTQRVVHNSAVPVWVYRP